MIVLLDRKITPEEFEKAREEYSDYIKTVIDVEREVMTVGGEFHIDGEQVLIKHGSKQSNLYGGGYRISTGEIEYMALSNYKPALGKITYEISDETVRNKMRELTEKYLL